MDQTLSLILAIVGAAVGATWVLTSKLSAIQVAISSLVSRVDNHEAKIINLEKRRRRA